MKFANRGRFYSGILILVILLVSYFVKFDVEAGANYVVTDTLLGILIFHNFFVLSLYILVGLLFIITGIKRIKIV